VDINGVFITGALSRDRMFEGAEWGTSASCEEGGWRELSMETREKGVCCSRGLKYRSTYSTYGDIRAKGRGLHTCLVNRNRALIMRKEVETP
jgi:hypothetical protein